MTGSAEDGPEWQKHIRSNDARRKCKRRLKSAVGGGFRTNL